MRASPAETFATTNCVVVGGEVGFSDQVDSLAEGDGRGSSGIVRDCVRDIGYEQEEFHWNTLEVTELAASSIGAYRARELTATGPAIKGSCSALPWTRRRN